MQKIVVVDICGTLFRSNTTFDFLRWLFFEDKCYRIFDRLVKLKLVSFANYWLFRIFRADVIRVLALRFLKGFSRERLLELSSIFYDDFLEKKRNQEIIDRVSVYQNAAGNRVLLASATVDFVAQTISEKFGINEFYSTNLNYIDGVCQGSINNDLLGCKLNFLNDKLNCSNFECVITDNFSDVDIITHSNHSILIQYTSTRKKWQSVLSKNILDKCEIIEI